MKLNSSGFWRNVFQSCSLHWSCSFLKQSWQYCHSCNVENLWKPRMDVIDASQFQFEFSVSVSWEKHSLFVNKLCWVCRNTACWQTNYVMLFVNKTLVWVTAKKNIACWQTNYVFCDNIAHLPTSYVFSGGKPKLKQKSQTQTELHDMHSNGVLKSLTVRIKVLVFHYIFYLQGRTMCDSHLSVSVRPCLCFSTELLVFG